MDTVTTEKSTDDAVHEDEDDIVPAKRQKKGSKGAKVEKNPLREMLARDLPTDKVDLWAEMVDRTYRAHVTLLAEPSSSSALKDALRDTEAFRMRGVNGSSYIGVFYSFPAAAESTTSPHKRSAPYQDAHASKLIHAALEARSVEDYRTISMGDMFILNDDNKEGYGARFMNLFRWAADPADGGKKVQRPSLINNMHTRACVAHACRPSGCPPREAQETDIELQ